MVKKNITLVNLKTYHSGRKVLSLVKALESVDKSLLVAVQPTDIHLVSSHSRVKVFSQHVDPVIPGRNTGFISPEAVKSSGAVGVLLNHSEHPLSFDTLKSTVKRCREVKLQVGLFASSLAAAKRLKLLKPDLLIIEPPSLVAGSVSVSSAKPGLIRKIAKELKYPFLVGAGIKSYDDINKALALGASGTAFSSIITKSKNPRKVLRSLLGK